MVLKRLHACTFTKLRHCVINSTLGLSLFICTGTQLLKWGAKKGEKLGEGSKLVVEKMQQASKEKIECINLHIASETASISARLTGESGVDSVVHNAIGPQQLISDSRSPASRRIRVLQQDGHVPLVGDSYLRGANVAAWVGQIRPSRLECYRC